MPEPTRQDALAFSRLVHEYWGAHLYMEFRDDASPCMDWKVVRLPTEFPGWSREELQQTILHEWGHRAISPISPVRGAIWRKAAEKTGLGEQQARLLVNLATDAWLDQDYLENPDWREVYRRGMADTLLRRKREEEGKDGAQEKKRPGNGEITLDTLYTAFYRRRIEKVGGKDLLPPEEPPAPEMEAMVAGMEDILFQGHLAPMVRIKRLAALLHDLMPQETILTLYSLLHPFTGRERDGGGMSARLWQEALDAGLTSADIDDILGPGTAEAYRNRQKRLELYTAIVPVVEKFFRQRQPRAFSGYTPWRVGRPMRELDIVATVQRSARMIPNTTTLARRFDVHGAQNGRGTGSVILVIDDSGSTEGETLRREKEAAMALIAAARRFGDPVGCVVFGGSVTWAIEPTSQYDRLENVICGLNSDSGGTLLAPALEKALQMAGDWEKYAIVVMTDAGIYDLNTIRHISRDMPAAARGTAFVFTDSEEELEEFAKSTGKRFRVFSARPDKPFAETALEEVYGAGRQKPEDRSQ